MHYVSRRQFLASTAAMGALSTVPSLLLPTRPARACTAATIQADTRVIEVKGRAATIFGLTQPDGTHGLVTEIGQRFRVRLENRLAEESVTIAFDADNPGKWALHCHHLYHMARMKLDGELSHGKQRT